MGTPHINAKKEDFAKVVLMPGDPVRAKWIAETFLEDYKLVNEVRGILAFTGYTKQNHKRITVMASGMGQPSIGIYSHELYSEFGVDAIIRVGTCASYQPDVDLFDIIIANTASTDSNWVKQYQLNGTYSAGADFDLMMAAYNSCITRNMPFHVGNILSADVFYDPDPNIWKSWAALGVLGVEMESFALYCNAAKFHKKALCVLTVTDLFYDRNKKATAEERAFSLKQMIQVGIDTAEQFAE